MPRLSFSVINTITIHKNGAVTQEIMDHHVSFDVLNNGLQEEDDLDSDKHGRLSTNAMTGSAHIDQAAGTFIASKSSAPTNMTAVQATRFQSVMAAFRSSTLSNRPSLRIHISECADQLIAG